MKKSCTVFLLFIIYFDNFSQSSTYNLSGYDDTKVHYGFLLGVHSSYYRLKEEIRNGANLKHCQFYQ